MVARRHAVLNGDVDAGMVWTDGHAARAFPALVETFNIAMISTLLGCLLGTLLALAGNRGLGRTLKGRLCMRNTTPRQPAIGPSMSPCAYRRAA